MSFPMEFLLFFSSVIENSTGNASFTLKFVKDKEVLKIFSATASNFGRAYFELSSKEIAEYSKGYKDFSKDLKSYEKLEVDHLYVKQITPNSMEYVHKDDKNKIFCVAFVERH
jgi:hypothetical protein